MPTILQLRRGTTTEHASFTGAEGEVTVNTTKDTLVVHDGSTQGGFEMALADLSNTNAAIGQAVATSDSPTFAGLTLTGNQEITGNIVPSADVTYDLGSSTKQWRDIYVGPGSLYVNGQQVVSDNSGTITISADANQDVAVQTSGSGDISLDPTGSGIVQVKSAFQIEDGNNITNSAGNPVAFSGGIKADSVTPNSADTSLTLSGAGTGTVAIADNTAITGTLSTTGNADIGGDLTITGNLQVDGTTTTINSTSLSVDDLNITVASGAANAAAANGAGITVDGASATINYASAGDKWTMNKPLDMGANSITTSGGVTADVTGNLTGTASNASTAVTLTGLNATIAELNYVDGVTSNIQTQIDNNRIDVYNSAGTLLN